MSMARLTGDTVILFDRVKTGVDPFGAPVFEEVPVEVDNVLICPASTESVTDGMQLYGKHAVFELLIPKCDGHYWESRTVSFYGSKWKTFGIPLRWQNPPGSWNRKVMVERYG